MSFTNPGRIIALMMAIIACSTCAAARAQAGHVDPVARVIAIDRDTIDAIQMRATRALTIELSKDVQLSLVIQDFEMRSPESFTCTGTVAGEVGSQFVMAAEDGALIATIWSPLHGTIQIRPLHDDQFQVEQVDPATLGGCACGMDQLVGEREDFTIPAQSPDRRITTSPNDSSCDRVIDVLVLYTDLAASAAGGESIIRAVAYASVASANIAYANSGIDAHLRLVYVAKTAYVESDNPIADLTALRTAGDGQIDEADTLREKYGADLVSLLIGSIKTNLCGVAFVMTDPSMPFDTFAFSVVHQSCALSNLSFAHELAHNLGCQHDWSDPSAGAFPYSHGLRFTGVSGQQWRTVMASTPGTRIPWFSNPDIEFDDVPTGVPIDQPNPADNALTINNTASIAAAFRTMAVLDCNGNGNPDACDIAEGISLDVNRNGAPDECDTPGAGKCAADELVSLTAPDAESFDRFGVSVSMSSDRVIVGSELDDDRGTQSGSAYVFVHDGSGWTMEAKLLASDGSAFDRFGHAVAISSDGMFAIVGAYRDAAPLLSDSGSVYFFRREGSTWVEDLKVANPDPAQADWFGWSVACGVDSDGSLFAMIGAPFDDGAAPDAGAAYVFVRAGAQWQFQTKLMAADAHSSSLFGHAVAAASGDRIVIGAGFDDAIASDAGAAYVFARAGASWLQEAKLVAIDPAEGDRFGSAVAISGDRVLIGSPRDDDAGSNSGSAIVFRRSGAAWVFEQKLEAPDAAAGDFFGTSVALHNDRALVGSILSFNAGAASGAAYIFHRGGGSWAEQAKIAPHDGAAYDNFGFSLAIAPDDSSLAAAGSVMDDNDSTVDGGSVRIVALDAVQPDCNGNGFDDACDIANGISMDRNNDGVPDECQAPVCAADVSGDGTVNAADLLSAINAWGPCPSPCPILHCAADVDGTCTIDELDLSEIMAHWGACP